MSKGKRKNGKRWIEVNDERDYVTENRLKYSLYSTPYAKKIRPVIHGHKQDRLMKDEVYLLIYEHIRRHRIKGAYIGLAAGYTPEIFGLMQPSIRREFVNCTLRRIDYRKLATYQPFIRRQFPQKDFGVDFQLHHGDVIKLMERSHRKFAIIDLDFMCILDYKRALQISQAIHSTAANRAVAAIWHTANRKQKDGDWWTDHEYRPFLRSELARYFYIHDYDKIEYYEGYPVRTDLFTLERKCRKASLRAV